MKFAALSFLILLGSAANAALSGLYELVDTYNPDNPTEYWKAIGTQLEQGLAIITLRAITDEKHGKKARKTLLSGFLRTLEPQKRFSEFKALIEEIERHGTRLFEELTLPVPRDAQSELPQNDPPLTASKSLADFDDCED